MIYTRSIIVAMIAILFVACGRDVSDPHEAVKGHWMSQSPENGAYVHLFIDGQTIIYVYDYQTDEEGFTVFDYTPTASKSTSRGNPNLHVTANQIDNDIILYDIYLLLQVRDEGTYLIINQTDKNYENILFYDRNEKYDYVDEEEYDYPK